MNATSHGYVAQGSNVKMKAASRTQLTYLLSEFKKYLGIDANSTSKREKFISGIGAMLSILLCQIITQQYFTPQVSLLLIASMGATATLVYALPHGALSQPWNVFGGHFISAIIGIICYQNIPDSLWASSIAVGGAVFAMYWLRCLHPPGGATALFCTQGGESVYNLGFHFLYQPLLLNVLVLIGVGILFNAFFSWRRYPAHLNFRHLSSNQSFNHLSHEDFSAALLKVDSFVDISTEELAVIFDQALAHANENKPQKKLLLKDGRFYSNGALGESWNIKQITEITPQQVTYKVIAGKDSGEFKTCDPRFFNRWALFEVEREQGCWIKSK